MPGRRRTVLQRNRDRLKIAELLIQRLSHSDIAKRVGLSQPQVSREVKIIQLNWAKEEPDKIRFLRNKELAKIDCVEKSAWEAFENSQKPRVITFQEKIASPAPGNVHENTQTGSSFRVKAGVRTEQRDGNPMFLNIVLGCIDRRCKMLGLYDPKVTQEASMGKVEPIKYIEVLLPPEPVSVPEAILRRLAERPDIVKELETRLAQEQQQPVSSPTPEPEPKQLTEVPAPQGKGMKIEVV